MKNILKNTIKEAKASVKSQNEAITNLEKMVSQLKELSEKEVQ